MLMLPISPPIPETMLIPVFLAIATTMLPSLPFGGAKYRFEGQGVRWLVINLVLTLPLVLVSGVLHTLLLGDLASDYGFLVGLIFVVAFGVASLIFSQFVRHPATTLSSDSQAGDGLPNVESIIAGKAQRSLKCTLAALLGFPAIVLCPLAFFHANQALRLIDKHQVGKQYRGIAHAVVINAVFIFLLYAAMAALILLIGISAL